VALPQQLKGLVRKALLAPKMTLGQSLSLVTIQVRSMILKMKEKPKLDARVRNRDTDTVIPC
jgi:hypothetical protein